VLLTHFNKLTAALPVFNQMASELTCDMKNCNYQRSFLDITIAFKTKTKPERII
jgi:hypothetical protein